MGKPKTEKSRRVVRLVPEATECLRAHRVRQVEERLAAGPAWEEHALVFTRPNGRPIDGRTVGRVHFYPLLKRAGLPQIRFHELRHTCATLALSANVNPKVVSEMLGHATVAITLDIYSHVLPDMQQDAVATLAAILYG